MGTQFVGDVPSLPIKRLDLYAHGVETSALRGGLYRISRAVRSARVAPFFSAQGVRIAEMHPPAPRAGLPHSARAPEENALRE
ncbi:hypothetical protein [Thermaurantiacus sp.]|uniref:hypothetical protein n=1 Tax=Thermaurantiacus sp. TaxID=2820283 RepID=UPI00298F34C9|nr:hypothetical protein [Thermaurantiacus sp.]